MKISQEDLGIACPGFRNAVKDELLQNALTELMPALPEARSIYLVGGYLRRAIREHSEGLLEPIGDLDLMVDAPAPLRLELRHLEGPTKRNVFGGLRWFPKAGFRHVDVWSVAEHYSVVEFKREPSIEEAMSGFPFNLERAAIDLTSGTALDGGMLEAVRTKVIEHDARDCYLPHLQGIRAVLLIGKTSYRLGTRLKDLVISRPWRGKEAEMISFLRNDGWTQSASEQLFSRADQLAFRLSAQ